MSERAAPPTLEKPNANAILTPIGTGATPSSSSAGSELSHARNPVATGVLVGIGYIVLCQFYWILAAGGLQEFIPGPLSGEELIGLLTGATTAATLAAIFVQIAQAQREAAERAQLGRVEAAMRAAELQTSYYSPEMVRARVHADIGLLDLSKDETLVEQMVRYWVDDDFGLPPRVKGPRCEVNGIEPLVVCEALTMMVGYFVRVQHHLETHRDLLDDRRTLDVMEFLGWASWRSHGLASFAQCCDVYQPTRKVGTYFVEQLVKLNLRYEQLVDNLVSPEDRAKRCAPRQLSLPPQSTEEADAVLRH
jgi:hypothetical protein